ncbi:hypothetical protein Hanom_Chr03g00276391 [Helianthus anomalus]
MFGGAHCTPYGSGLGSVMVVMDQWKTITDPCISVFRKSLTDPSAFSSVRFFWFCVG